MAHENLQLRRINICSNTGGFELEKRMNKRKRAQQLMISQKSEGWQGEGFPALGPQISPLPLGRGENALAAHNAQRQDTFSPLLAASEHENTGGLGKEREQEEEEGQFMHPARLSLAGKHWPLPRGQHSRWGLTSPTANSWVLPPSSQRQPRNSKQPRLLLYYWTTRPAPWCV